MFLEPKQDLVTLTSLHLNMLFLAEQLVITGIETSLGQIKNWHIVVRANVGHDSTLSVFVDIEPYNDTNILWGKRNDNFLLYLWAKSDGMLCVVN